MISITELKTSFDKQLSKLERSFSEIWLEENRTQPKLTSCRDDLHKLIITAREIEDRLHDEIHHGIRKLLIQHEGVRLHAYKDSKGYITIGVGRLIDHWRGGGITTSEAMYLLDNDILEVEEDLDRQLPWWRGKSQAAQLVLMDMRFNLGMKGLLKFKKFLHALEENDTKTARKEMMDSKWARETGERARELSLLL